MLRRILLATASVIAVSAAANAADMYRAPEAVSYKDVPYVGVNWSGFYIGANGGYAWANSAQMNAPTAGFGGVTPEGGLIGGQLGYNVQRGNMVFGVETDLDAANVNASTTFVSVSAKSELNWLGSLRGRVGFTFDRALVYGTGGLAYGGVHNHIQNLAGTVVFDKDDTAVGYTLGGGLEYKISPSFSIKGEYQFVDLGKNCATQTAPAAGAGRCVSTPVPAIQIHDDAYHTFRIGLNYFVSPAYEPLK